MEEKITLTETNKIKIMPQLNIEIKAYCKDQNKIRDILRNKNADFKGAGHQIDTYFRVDFGRLKFREGKIKNVLIFYDREDKKGPKKSKITLFESNHLPILKRVLARSLGILAIVDKQREVYFIDNVKFHIDKVKNLGTFIEIEAVDRNGRIGKQKLFKQCKEYLTIFNIKSKDLISRSYSDLILERT